MVGRSPEEREKGVQHARAAKEASDEQPRAREIAPANNRSVTEANNHDHQPNWPV